jgi:hypothetical protein
MYKKYGLEFMKVVAFIMSKHKPQFSQLDFGNNFTIKKRPKHYLGLSKMAESRGFEPLEDLTLRLISSQVH